MNSQGSKCLGRNLKMDVRGIKEEKSTGTGKILPKPYPLLPLPESGY